MTDAFIGPRRRHDLVDAVPGTLARGSQSSSAQDWFADGERIGYDPKVGVRCHADLGRYTKVSVLIGSDFRREWVEHYRARPLILPHDY